MNTLAVLFPWVKRVQPSRGPGLTARSESIPYMRWLITSHRQSLSFHYQPKTTTVNTANAMPSHEVPRIRADKQLKEFRREANLSWESFNTLWLQVCQFVYSPSHDILLGYTNTSNPNYLDLINAIKLAGYFNLEARAAWVLGIYTLELDQDEYAHPLHLRSRFQLTILRFTEYVGRLVAYAAQQFIKQIPAGHPENRPQSDKVTRWLSNDKNADCTNVRTPGVKSWRGIANET